MEFTDQYIHVCLNKDQNPAPVFYNDAYRLTISQNNDRPPYALVEVISATIIANTNIHNTFVLRAEEIAGNFYCNENKGTTLALIDYNTQITAGHQSYNLTSSGSKVLFSNAQTLSLYITDEIGIKVGFGAGEDIDGMNLIIKVSYPVVNSIQPSYKAQVPLPNGRLL